MKEWPAAARMNPSREPHIGRSVVDLPINLLPFTKDSRAYADEGSALFDGDFKIMTHPH